MDNLNFHICLLLGHPERSEFCCFGSRFWLPHPFPRPHTRAFVLFFPFAVCETEDSIITNRAPVFDFSTFSPWNGINCVDLGLGEEKWSQISPSQRNIDVMVCLYGVASCLFDIEAKGCTVSWAIYLSAQKNSSLPKSALLRENSLFWVLKKLHKSGPLKIVLRILKWFGRR